MQNKIEDLVRENIKRMKPYSSARHEFHGNASVLLDANENAFGSPLPENYNRYPDPLQSALKQKIAGIKGIAAENIFLGNGSDEAIDLLIRIFCEPGLDNIIICPPTYGMYEVCAGVNDVRVRKVPLKENLQLDIETVLKLSDSFTKLIFICSPNNPTGNIIGRTDIETVLRNFNGLVIIDEAYIDYSRQHSYINALADYPNLVVLQTLSKAWGLAGLRLGMAFASPKIIGYLSKIKYPYNVNAATQKLAMEALESEQSINVWTKQIVGQRKWLREHLVLLPFVKKIYPSDANFLLVKMEDADAVYNYLASKGVIVRNRSNQPGCENCLRITIGTPDQNDRLLNELKNLIL